MKNRPSEQPARINQSNPIFQNKENHMNANITVVGKVVEVTPVSGTTKDGKKFNYVRLSVETNNGRHYERIQPRKDADKSTVSVFAKAKVGDMIEFSECFLDGVLWKNEAYVRVLAGKATKI